jgi:hypothetical protein
MELCIYGLLRESISWGSQLTLDLLSPCVGCPQMISQQFLLGKGREKKDGYRGFVLNERSYLLVFLNYVL